MIRFLASVLLLAIAAPNSFGAIKYWDINGPTPGAGLNGAPTGTWDTTGVKNNWSANADGTGAEVAWTAGSDAVFAAGSDATGTYDVTLIGNPNLASLSVEEGAVSATGGGAGNNTLDFGAVAGAPINIASGATFTEPSSTVFASTGGLTKTGAGTLVLRGTNTFTKSGTANQAFLTIAGGVVDFTTDLNLGAVPTVNDNGAALTIDGGTLKFGGGTSLTLAVRRGMRIGASGGTIDVPGAVNLSLPAAAPTAAALTGSGLLTKTGIGRFSLNTSQTTFTGKYLVTGGSLSFSSDGTLGAIPASVQSDYITLNGGALRVSVQTHATLNTNRGITLGASGGALVGPIEGISYSGVISGTQGGKLTIALQDAVTDSSTFGVVELFGTSTYDGATQIETGMSLRTSMLGNGGANSGIGKSSNAASNLILNGGKLAYTGSTTNTDRRFTLTQAGGAIDNIGSQALTFSSTDAITMTGTGARTLTLGGNSSANNTFSPAITDAGASQTTLVKSGPAFWTVTNPNNSYTGNTTITAGRLKLGAAGVIPDMSLVTLSGTTTVFDLNGFDETVRSISGTQGTIALGANTLRLNSPTGETFSGVISGAGGRLVKAGAGTLTLGGVNTYTGDTEVQDGTLQISNAYLANGADVRLAGAGKLSLTFSGTDAIDSLFFNGIPQATGTWGSLASAATHKSSLFIGNGMLQVTSPLSGIAGDFDNNGVVDAGDYISWRKNKSTNNALANDNGLGTPVGSAHYSLWRANFGQPSGSGSGSGLEAETVPEAGSIVLLLIGLLTTAVGRGARMVR